MPRVGILQLVEHDALDASYKGFVDALAEAGYVDGTNISIDYQNAQGEQANCQTIAQKFVNDRCDLILAIATPAAQAAANLTDTIPILVTAVTDPESAKLVKSNAMPGTNVSGTSDLTPVEAQIKLLKKIAPGAKKPLFCIIQASKTRLFKSLLQKKRAMKSALPILKRPFPIQTKFSRRYKTLSARLTRFTFPPIT